MSTTRLYRHYDKGGDLLYVGISMNAIKRLSEHAKWSSWFDKVATVTIETFADKESALAAERSVIQSECPRHNTKPLGRKPTFDALTVRKVRDLIAAAISPSEIADMVGISRATVYRIKDEPEKVDEILRRWGAKA